MTLLRSVSHCAIPSSLLWCISSYQDESTITGCVPPHAGRHRLGPNSYSLRRNRITGQVNSSSYSFYTLNVNIISCTVSGTAFNAGGSISVNNFNIQVPQNLIVSLPVVWTPFRDLCSAGAIGFETSVVGNIVNGVVIAGQVQVSQRFAVEGSQGYISAINTDGSLSITGGPKVRINDPDGLFGPKVTSNPFWVADTESPSVTSFSGFPMCIPYSGNIASCLSSNRGTGNSFSPPDPLRMVPFKVGDFIEFSGLRVNGEILASVIVCPSLAITTVASVTVPNYIRIEELRVGVVSAAGNVEVADTRIVGFLSSCSGATVTISAIDVDPCTGVETYRHVGTANPVQDVRCKFDARFAPSTPFTREYRITTNGPVVTTKDGIEAGQYVQPVSEFIFPEVDVPGTFPPANPFTDFRALVQGDCRSPILPLFRTITKMTYSPRWKAIWPT